MELFWAIFASFVLVLIVYGIVSSKVGSKRLPALGGIVLPRVEGSFSLEKRYLVVINTGARFDGVRFRGFADAVSGPNDRQFWSPSRWLVLEHDNGIKSFVNPFTIKYFREL